MGSNLIQAQVQNQHKNNRIKAIYVGAGCFLTTLKRCFGILRLPLGHPGGFPRTLGLRAGEPNCAKIRGKLC